MSSPLRKIQKNMTNFNIDNLYQNMTPEQYKQGIRIAIQRTERELTDEFNLKYQKLITDFNNDMREGMRQAIDTISVELLYELASQMECFTEEDEDLLEQKINKVREIYENTMETIRKYNKYKTNNQARKEFLKKKNKVEKMFNIKF